jgi:hypothetical protein
MDVTDDAVWMTLDVIRRIETQTEKHLEKTLLQDIKRVAGKVQLLYRIAEAVVEAPDGTIRNVLFPCVTEDTFHDLVAEAHASHPVRLKNSAASIQLKPLRFGVYWAKGWCHHLQPEERP